MPASEVELMDVNEEALGETILATVTIVVIALILSLMLMASMNVHFSVPHVDKGPASELTDAPKKISPSTPTRD
jgi:hypothetical protein